MSTIATRNLTLSDVIKMKAPNGGPAMVLEGLDQKHSLINDLHWEECNDNWNHETTFRSSLPTPSRRILNTPVNPSKGTTDQARWGVTAFEDWAVADELVAERLGNPAAIMAQEVRAKVEAMRQDFSEAFFYDNPSGAPHKMTGLSTYYSTIGAAYNRNLLDADGTGSDNASIWVIDHGPGKVYGIYPKGSMAGMKMEDFGKQTVDGATGVSGSKMRAYQAYVQWVSGLAIEDWECAVRICNIDISNLIAKSSNADILELLSRAVGRLRNPESSSVKIYMNRTVAENLVIYKRDDVIAGGGLTYDNVDGIRQLFFGKIPVRIDDQLLNSESRVV